MASVQRDGCADSLDDDNSIDDVQSIQDQLSARLREADGKVTGNQRLVGELRSKKARCDDEVNRKSKDKGRLEEAIKHMDSIATQFRDKVGRVF